MTPPAAGTLLVTGACGVTSRSVVRALRRSAHFAGARIVGTDVCRNPYAIAEGLYAAIYAVPDVREPGYDAAIAAVLEAERPDLALVVPELEVVHWARRPPPVPCLLPPDAFNRLAGAKGALYQALRETDLVPAFAIHDRDELADSAFGPSPGWPCWIRDHEAGATSGRGSLLAGSRDELRAWVTLNPGIDSFMLAEYLPGRNFACHLLYHEGALIKTGTYERLEYFMGRIAPSGISGNISRGRLLNDRRVLEASRRAVEHVARAAGATMHGLVAVDLREDAAGQPKITEINLRHVACTSAFADAGHNLVEAQALAALGMPGRAGPVEAEFPPGNLILRDIDGPALWVAEPPVPRRPDGAHEP